MDMNLPFKIPELGGTLGSVMHGLVVMFPFLAGAGAIAGAYLFWRYWHSWKHRVSLYEVNEKGHIIWWKDYKGRDIRLKDGSTHTELKGLKKEINLCPSDCKLSLGGMRYKAFLMKKDLEYAWVKPSTVFSSNPQAYATVFTPMSSFSRLANMLEMKRIMMRYTNKNFWNSPAFYFISLLVIAIFIGVLWYFATESLTGLGGSLSGAVEAQHRVADSTNKNTAATNRLANAIEKANGITPPEPETPTYISPLIPGGTAA